MLKLSWEELCEKDLKQFEVQLLMKIGKSIWQISEYFEFEMIILFCPFPNEKSLKGMYQNIVFRQLGKLFDKSPPNRLFAILQKGLA